MGDGQIRVIFMLVHMNRKGHISIPNLKCRLMFGSAWLHQQGEIWDMPWHERHQ
jgi:hypothetical protein